MAQADNPRAVIGHNHPPPDAGAATAENPAVTVAEARAVMRAIEYVQWCWPELKSILIKHSKKHKLEMAFRIAIAHALKGEVRLDALRILLSLNRKTCSENQHRPELWAEYDPVFDAIMEDFREVLYRHGRLDRDAMSERLKHWIEADPVLRDLEKEEKAKAKALAKSREQDEIDAARKRLDEIAALKKALRSGGVVNADAIAARLEGADALAKSISEEAMDVLERMMKKEAKGKREVASFYDVEGLEECLRLGLARDASPYNPAKRRDPDPPIGPTALCAKVYVEAVALKRIAVKEKRK